MAGTADNSTQEIRSRACPECYLCGSPGIPLYQGLPDRLFGAPGQWNFKQCPNSRCGLVWLDPMPLKEDIAKAYTVYFTHNDSSPRNSARLTLLRQVYGFAKDGYLARRFGYATAHSGWQMLAGLVFYLSPPYRALVEKSVLGLQAFPGGHLLDVGCGRGDLVAQLSALGWQAEGLEVDPEAVNQARSRGIKVNLGDLESQTYPEACFDVITMNHVIEHVHDPIGLLRECHRLLKPGGWCLAFTPNLESWGHKSFKDNWVALDPPRHLFLFNPPALRALAEGASLKVQSLTTTIQGSHWISLASRAMASQGFYVPKSCPSLSESLRANAFSLAEWGAHKLYPFRGEELVLVGQK
jgi:2-polyprenyl-3-methyl-5-hydroxy-6-metoxy-1,4-benzoquinol methylase